MSYYLNNDISTVTDKNTIIELPPRAFVALPNSSFKKPLLFNSTTLKKLKATKIKYGIAAKYTSTSTTKVKSLYKQTTKSAYDIYKQQMK